MILTKAQRINACVKACAGIPDDEPRYDMSSIWRDMAEKTVRE